ncbi:MAG: EAL domain-containing protein, partial [Mesorhizobium sp.]|nr:EAL domain-containing protein [Mesorhizobium sp.]
VAVNLSTRQFANGDLAHKIEASLRRTRFDRARLELEITESVLLKDSSINLVTLRRLREIGIRIALDDFGTGYSSLGYLQKFPFSKIKIDRSFVSGLPQNEESQAIVRAVIGLGQALGMRVTAEGVETQEQFDWIKSGCDEAQGYFLSRPVPGREVPGLLKSLGEKLPAGRQLSRLAG